ncbi:hypothetical protein DVH24_019768 [Malus domestica]|uniref:Uncharacterized protein n=1 Tax=Malus domestica TaxID=3750 RepID=A0A498I196_MALDO|nr:hypothetical protein DVH24_019768 [Malus domestica]
MAWRLANSKQPFLYVIRSGSICGSDWIDLLPQGFAEAIGERGDSWVCLWQAERGDKATTEEGDTGPDRLELRVGALPGCMGFSPILEREMGQERDTERKAWVCVFFRVNGLCTESVRRGWVRDEWQGLGFQFSPLIQKNLQGGEREGLE